MDNDLPMVVPKVMHRSVRPNYYVISLVIGVCLLGPCAGNVMGEQCDWSGK